MSLRAEPGHYSVYGYDFLLEGNCTTATEGLAEDFAFFATSVPTSAPVRLILNEGTPDYAGLPELDASVYTPRNVVYRDGERRILDFGGKGLGIYEPAQRRFTMTSESGDLIYEAGYLFLLSQIGQEADRRALSRVHAMAMSYRGRAILAMLPMGGGKSTLASALLQHKEMQLLSDDSPLVNRQGKVLAFPLRIGLLPGQEKKLPPEQVRKIDRMEFGPKFLVNYSFFAERVISEAEPGMLLFGRRTLAAKGRLEEMPYWSAMQEMVPHSIIGLGLFQGLEYLLQRSSRELVNKIGVGISRTRNAHALVRRSHNFALHMGRNPAQNAEMVLEAAERLFASGR